MANVTAKTSSNIFYKARCEAATHNEQLSSREGAADYMSIVQKAMSDYGWYHPQEAFATMDELTLAVVKNLGWSRLCQSENPTADRANFREAYEKKAAEAQNTNALPDFIAKNKVLLQKQYVPAVEKKEPVRIEQEKEPEPKPLTEEQREERARKFEEIRRKILGGEAE